jgi:site-specific recombinase XerD
MVSSKVKIVGPLAPYAGRFGCALFDLGYTDLSAADQFRLMGHFSRWMVSQGLAADALSDAAVQRYCRYRKSKGYTARLKPSSLGRLLSFLRDEGVLVEPLPAAPTGPDELLVARYEAWLANERGLVEEVVARWTAAAAAFVAGHPGLSTGVDVIGTPEVTAFLARELPGRGASSARELAAALRSFLRFLHIEGLVSVPLAQAVPPVAFRKGAGLPRWLAPQIVARLLASCDRRTGRGRRDYAILLVLARLGLRAGEVARLSLDDIDWRAGELVVHGKGRRDDRLPLPPDVGEALVAYLRRGRPRTETRTVFLRAIAPRVALSPPAITWVVTSACERAGVPKASAHQLRHSLATHVLRTGGSLIEAGQILRHELVGTTQIYAKVDFAALAQLVQPWPGGAA